MLRFEIFIFTFICQILIITECAPEVTTPTGCEQFKNNLQLVVDRLTTGAGVVNGIQEKLEQYIFLRCLQNTNQDVFYRNLVKDLEALLPVVYTPVVGLACQKYGLVPWQQNGLFISINDKGNVEQKLRSVLQQTGPVWRKLGSSVVNTAARFVPFYKRQKTEVKAIVVTDGERILGLGDLGANGMGIPVGKLALYTAIGGVHPRYCLPVTLDVGTNNEELLKPDSPYVGLRQKRGDPNEYKELVDEFMKAVVNVYGRNTLIQFEDFANENAFNFLTKYRDQYTMFNDDIQGTAAVTVAGILAAVRFMDKKLEDFKVLFVGAGEAGVGIANLLVTAMGGDADLARKRIYMKRSKKLIVKGDEKNYKDDDDRRLYCHVDPEGRDITNLDQIIKWIKPNILIGVSGQGGIFNKEVLEAMAEVSDTPIIMPLSNPTSQSECTAEEAYTHTKGKCLFASGSPFVPVKNVQGQTRHPGQCNNAYVFPGLALAITATQMNKVPEDVFLIAAKTLANTCTFKEDFDKGGLFPPMERIRDCSVEIAVAVATHAFENKLTNLQMPKDIRKFILSHHYSPPK
ncbi:NADP-dependent malic enzyme-like [Macrosteles quadrilineatus]|uniref:NADP-dependent malic enzyme-like n=1 Tax=Macrosteles quadrilineatus TaxID=74068 RepID=UPI0023E2BCF5|nr:NADP-dependent malic enzyme-like [Macrosteles quadrilineatus]